MRDFIVARSWRTFDKQQVVALAEICRLISFHRKEMNKAEIHINVNNPNLEMQEMARKIVPENIKLFFYDNQFLEDYVRNFGIEPDVKAFKEWEWIYHILLYHYLHHARNVNYLLTYDDDILFNGLEFKDIVHFVCSKIPFSIADQYHDADKPMMGKLVERFGNEVFENYYRCFGNARAGNSGFMGFNNSIMSKFFSTHDMQWLIDAFIYSRWDHKTMQGTGWDDYKILLQEQSFLSILNRAYSDKKHILLVDTDGYILSQDLELMKQSKVMHFISTTKYDKYYLDQIEERYEKLKQLYAL